MINQEVSNGIIGNSKREGDFSLFLDQKIGLIRFVKKDFIQYTKIHLVNAILENYIDIMNNSAAMTEILSRKTGLLELCGQPSSNKICYYSQDDISLGTFILNKVKNLFTKCERDGCCRPRNNHISFYFQGIRFVRIFVEITGFIRATAMNSDGKYVIFEENKVNERMSSSNSGKFEAGTFNTNINREIALNNFKTFIACECCGFKLTEEKPLEKGYLEYSFTRFLSHFFANSLKKTKIEDFPIESSPESLKKCQHLLRKRVFQYGEFMINFTSGIMRTFRLDFHRISSKASISLVQEASDRVLQQKRELYLKTFKPLIKGLINLMKERIKDPNNGLESLEVFNNKSLLDLFLNKIQNFALSVETSLNLHCDCYLDLESQRISLASQFSGLLEIFLMIYQKKPDFSVKLKDFLNSFSQESQELNEKTSRNIRKSREFSPGLRISHNSFKRSLSSNKDFNDLEKKNDFHKVFIKKDLRFSSNQRLHEKDSYEKLGFFKKLSRFSEKNLEKTEFANNKDDSGSETEDIINEKEENPFELSETELKLENSAFEDHDEGVSPQLLLEINQEDQEIGISGKKNAGLMDQNSIEEIFKDLKVLNTGLEVFFIQLNQDFNAQIIDIAKLQKYVCNFLFYYQ